ncbi:MAG: arsenate reductase ArsC [Thermaerobacterales bacterium]
MIDQRNNAADVRRVLFLCTHNSARSQMAEGLLQHLGGKRFQVESAGTEAARVRPEAVAVMLERGIDINHHTSKTLDRFVGQDPPFDKVITVCDSAAQACPVFPGAKEQLHWPYPDPAGVTGDETTRLNAFRQVRDALEERITRWLESQIKRA